MKRIVCVIIALTLAISPAALGESLSKKFETKHYTLMLPSNWVLDFDDLDESEDSWELGYAYSYATRGGSLLCLTAYLDYYSSWSDFSLWNADSAGMAEYSEYLMGSFKSHNPEIADIITVGKIPFFVVRLYDDGAMMYWVETMTNGYAVSFSYYAMSPTDYSDVDVPEEGYELLIDILKTFKPII